jgi:hypothetical protein
MVVIKFPVEIFGKIIGQHLFQEGIWQTRVHTREAVLLPTLLPYLPGLYRQTRSKRY